jgi:hypothetical protein
LSVSSTLRTAASTGKSLFAMLFHSFHPIIISLSIPLVKPLVFLGDRGKIINRCGGK